MPGAWGFKHAVDHVYVQVCSGRMGHSSIPLGMYRIADIMPLWPRTLEHADICETYAPTI